MNKKISKFLPIAVILLGMATIYFTGVYKYLSFDTLRLYHQAVKSFMIEHPVAVPALYCITYVVCTALSVPGAIFLTLLGGYLFAQPLSTIYVVVSATCGASLIFLAASTALEEVLRKKAGPFLKKMEKGFQEHAANYLLFLRFVPLFPFWLVNIAPAFFGVSFFTFVWTTFLGIIPGTLVFTFAGAGLEQIVENNEPFSLNTIFNFQIKIALLMLGITALVPLVYKRLRSRGKD